MTKIDRWFLYQLRQIFDFEKELSAWGLSRWLFNDRLNNQSKSPLHGLLDNSSNNSPDNIPDNISDRISDNIPDGLSNNRTNQVPADMLKKAKSYGFSDKQISFLTGIKESELVMYRKIMHIAPVYKLVDTCAAEFKASTPYYYSTYELESEARISDDKKVIILGGGPNRIGQGIEFDYCCVHASFALAEEGVESIMVNSNPETVSTDYDTSDKLYFEPLTSEDVLHIIETEKPDGVIVQFGGQTPLNIADELDKEGVPIIGTQPTDIAKAEDRDQFQAMLKKLGLVQPANGIAMTVEDAFKIADEIGYPVIVRPSYVLGGRAMKIVFDSADLEEFVKAAIDVSPGNPVLIDYFLADAIELDVDAVSDGETTIIAGIMEHIEEAGIHSGDSSCVLPAYSIKDDIVEELTQATKAMAKELNVVGLMNVQYAVQDNKLYVIEVNPRASRTIPFVSKATGIPFAKIATKVMLGRSLKELGITKEVIPPYYSVKEAVLPFDRFPDVDTLLGPEMKSTGEVMGIDNDLGTALAKAYLGSRMGMPLEGTVFISIKDGDKNAALPVAKMFYDIGFKLMATKGTSLFLDKHNIPNSVINKVSVGRPDVVDAIKNSEIQLVLNTGSGTETKMDGYKIRRAALKYKIPYATTTAGAMAICKGIAALKSKDFEVMTIQEYHRKIK
ncbi:MAG: carbamoyl phosphate synthase large subunit [Desulfobacteraceae bacterium 4572_19]|nr:MAG: carbamoyl phosphate synthase large subunit [Desulfobacteraceae bacterium 4572_19]